MYVCMYVCVYMFTYKKCIVRDLGGEAELIVIDVVVDKGGEAELIVVVVDVVGLVGLADDAAGAEGQALEVGLVRALRVEACALRVEAERLAGVEHQALQVVLVGGHVGVARAVHPQKPKSEASGALQAELSLH